MPGRKLDHAQTEKLHKVLAERLANRGDRSNLDIYKELGKEFGISPNAVYYHAKSLNGTKRSKKRGRGRGLGRPPKAGRRGRPPRAGRGRRGRRGPGRHPRTTAGGGMSSRIAELLNDAAAFRGQAKDSLRRAKACEKAARQLQRAQ